MMINTIARTFEMITVDMIFSFIAQIYSGMNFAEKFYSRKVRLSN